MDSILHTDFQISAVARPFLGQVFDEEGTCARKIC